MSSALTRFIIHSLTGKPIIKKEQRKKNGREETERVQLQLLVADTRVHARLITTQQTIQSGRSREMTRLLHTSHNLVTSSCFTQREKGGMKIVVCIFAPNRFEYWPQWRCKLLSIRDMGGRFFFNLSILLKLTWTARKIGQGVRDKTGSFKPVVTDIRQRSIQTTTRNLSLYFFLVAKTEQGKE